MIKNLLDVLNMLNWIRTEDYNSIYTISLSTNNLRLPVQKQKRIEDTNIDKEAYIQIISKKTRLTHIFDFSLIKKYRKLTFLSEK